MKLTDEQVIKKIKGFSENLLYSICLGRSFNIVKGDSPKTLLSQSRSFLQVQDGILFYYCDSDGRRVPHPQMEQLVKVEKVVDPGESFESSGKAYSDMYKQIWDGSQGFHPIICFNYVFSKQEARAILRNFAIALRSPHPEDEIYYNRWVSQEDIGVITGDSKSVARKPVDKKETKTSTVEAEEPFVQAIEFNW